MKLRAPRFPRRAYPGQGDLLALLDGTTSVEDVPAAGDCPAVDDRGRSCGRWDLPGAHSDGRHGPPGKTWPM